MVHGGGRDKIPRVDSLWKCEYLKEYSMFDWKKKRKKKKSLISYLLYGQKIPPAKL